MVASSSAFPGHRLQRALSGATLRQMTELGYVVCEGLFGGEWLQGVKRETQLLRQHGCLVILPTRWSSNDSCPRAQTRRCLYKEIRPLLCSGCSDDDTSGDKL